jgi:hypothetical protein
MMGVHPLLWVACIDVHITNDGQERSESSANGGAILLLVYTQTLAGERVSHSGLPGSWLCEVAADGHEI